MKHSREEILDALKIIKEECKSNKCRECPFWNEDKETCNFLDKYPVEWILNIENTSWHAFQ